VHVLRGGDPALLGSAVTELVHRLVGADDRSLVVEELDGEDYSIGALVDAAQTPPFLTEHRVVVGRGIERFSADELKVLGAYLRDPLTTTDLVLAAAGERLPKSFLDAVKASGGTITDTDVSTRRADRDGWVAEQVVAAGLRLDRAARDAVVAHFGEDLGRLASLLDTLQAAYGQGARIGTDDLAPFLGEGGSVPPWDLTDAIDRGDAAAALAMLERMLHAGVRHPLQVMAILHGHFTRMLRLDGSGAHDERAAATLLGLKGSTFPARKALDQLKRLGPEGLRRSFALLARADLDLRGQRDLPEELVMEVLVARLARLTPARR
jgi:DNA polymerase-3 subunit delta